MSTTSGNLYCKLPAFTRFTRIQQNNIGLPQDGQALIPEHKISAPLDATRLDSSRARRNCTYSLLHQSSTLFTCECEVNGSLVERRRDKTSPLNSYHSFQKKSIANVNSVIQLQYSFWCSPLANRVLSPLEARNSFGQLSVQLRRPAEVPLHPAALFSLHQRPAARIRPLLQSMCVRVHIRSACPPRRFGAKDCVL